MSLIELFKESVACNRDNDDIMYSAVKKLGDLIENSHTLPKHATSDIHQILLKAILSRKRIKVIQDKLSKEMLLQHQKISTESDEGLQNKDNRVLK